jgi:hypothetical protein
VQPGADVIVADILAQHTAAAQKPSAQQIGQFQHFMPTCSRFSLQHN